jgi:O-antigen ligase
MVVIVQFAFYLTRSSQSVRFWRLAGTIYIILGTFAILVTFSRTSYLFLALVTIANYWESLKNPRLLLWLIATVGTIFFVYRLFPSDLILARISTIAPYTQATFSEPGEVTTARGFAWRVGLAMFRSNPIVGVGYGTFNDAYSQYRNEVTSIIARRGSARSAHNAYISILAELGLTGLVLSLILLFNTFPALYRSFVYFRRKPSSDSWILIQAMMYAFLLEVSYGWAVNILTNKLLWLLLGLIASCLHLVNTSEAQQSIGENTSEKNKSDVMRDRIGIPGAG